MSKNIKVQGMEVTLSSVTRLLARLSDVATEGNIKLRFAIIFFDEIIFLFVITIIS